MTLDPYSSHIPLLVGAVAATRGKVVELGAGFYSTPVLQALCTAQGRELTTIETDREWLNKFAFEKPCTGLLIDNWEELHRFGSLLECDVAFIDVAPAEARAELIHTMKRWARVIVVHDVEVEQQHNYPGVEDALRSYKYRIEDRRRGPWTAAVSNEDIRQWSSLIR